MMLDSEKFRNRKKSLSVLLFIVSIMLAGPIEAATISWKASVGEVDGYRLYYSTSSSSSGSFVNVGNVTSYSLDQLPIGENAQYYLRLAAYNAAGVGAHSSPIAFTTGDSTPPTPPIALAISSTP